MRSRIYWSMLILDLFQVELEEELEAYTVPEGHTAVVILDDTKAREIKEESIIRGCRVTYEQNSSNNFDKNPFFDKFRNGSKRKKKY